MRECTALHATPHPPRIPTPLQSAYVAASLDTPLGKLSATAWSSVSEVGDQSAYVGDSVRLLRAFVPKVRSRLSEASFRNFCDKFGRALMPRYQSAIFRCKRIGETGAQQLLLDAQAMRALLLAAPVLRQLPIGDQRSEDDEGDTGTGVLTDESAPPAPPLYSKFVQREMPRVEMLLKIIACPKERFGDTIRALWPEASLADLTRVMELKGLAKREQTEVLVAMGLMKQPAPAVSGLASMGISLGGGGLGSATGASSTSSGAPGGSGAAKLGAKMADVGSKLFGGAKKK